MKYIVEFPFMFDNESSGYKQECNISGNTIDYMELGRTYSGVQVINQENESMIREKCSKIAELFREINELNKI